MAGKRRAAPFEIEVPSVYDPADAIESALRKAFPKAQVVGVGVGRRRRNGRYLREIVIKIVVRRKRDPKELHRGRDPLPVRLSLVSRALGRRIRVDIGTDVEGVPKARATYYSIDPGTNGALSVGAYALWRDGAGKRRVGLVTAGHGLWKKPDAPRPVRKADVLIDDMTGEVERLHVVCASHIKLDGLDVGLLRFSLQPVPEIAAKLKRIWGKAKVADRDFLTRRLGEPDDPLDMKARFKFPEAFADCESKAYYGNFTVDVEDWGVVTMKQAVESTGPAQSFVPGTSGSGVMSMGTRPRYALGVQSMALDPPDYRRGLSTSFDAARAWLRKKVNPDLRLVWSPTYFKP